VRQVEQRVTGQFLKIEGPSGIVVSVPGWMVDALVCPDMKIGPPQVNRNLILAVFGGVTPLARCAAAHCALPNDTPKSNKMGHIKGNMLVL
jgi:hypothetical protein